ncbi:MAG: hypothetical protein K2J39_00850 [Ruminococcus sp.]|nr:hypothetical protein [Ruminococcus sp.]
MSKTGTSEQKQEKAVSVKLTCDNSAFLQSLDEIEKKIDRLLEKLNQMKSSFIQIQD